jgi:hypothetical protein
VNCGACTDFRTCRTINDFIPLVPDAMDNLTGK